jgi:hypothetical protein
MLGTHNIKKKIVVVKRQYFCLVMKKDVVDYISRCLECNKVKDKHKHPIGLLQPFPIPNYKWEVVTIDFITIITKLPLTVKQHDSIMVVVDKITKVAHFILVKITHKQDKIIRIYMRKNYRLHGVPKAIVSNRYPKFTSNF